jgi:hypothetical protein
MVKSVDDEDTSGQTCTLTKVDGHGACQRDLLDLDKVSTQKREGQRENLCFVEWTDAEVDRGGKIDRSNNRVAVDGNQDIVFIFAVNSQRVVVIPILYGTSLGEDVWLKCYLQV